MDITARGYFLWAVVGGLVGLFPALRAELSAAQRAQAQESAVAIAAGRVAEADKLQPAEATVADRAEWLERRGRWLLRDEKSAEAGRDFLAAKNLTPNSVPVAAGLAEVAWQLGRLEEMENHLKAAVELRKTVDPEARFEDTEPGGLHVFLLLRRPKGVDENTIEQFGARWGDALPEALFMAAQNAGLRDDLATAVKLCDRAIQEAGGKFPAAQRQRRRYGSELARNQKEEQRENDRALAEGLLAQGDTDAALKAARGARVNAIQDPDFASSHLRFARAVTAVVLRAQPGPRTISEVDADTLEATHIFASVPNPDAAAVEAETALLARLRQIDPLWPAGTLPAPPELTADSPLRQALTAEPLRAGSDRVAALEKAFLAEWGRGPTAVDLETAEGRARWGNIGREGALIAHLRWLTLPDGPGESYKARTDARKRTILALLCVPEDAVAVRAAKEHRWFKEPGEQSYVNGNPGVLTQKLKTLSAGKQAKDSAPPENGEELLALLNDVMPLAEGKIDLANTCPGIAAAVAVRVTDVVGRLRLQRQKDVAFIATALADFVWDWTYDPARAMDVTDWGDAQQQMPSAQVRYAFQPPAGLEKTPLGRHVMELDAWVWNGAEPKAEPVTPAPWAKVPSVVWRHALGSGGTSGNFKRFIEANRSGAWGMSLSISSSAGQAIQLLDKRLGDKVVAPMNGPAAEQWFGALAEIEAMLKDPGVTPEVRTRLGNQLDLHRAQVMIASGQRELAKKNMPELVARLESPPSGPKLPRAPREEQGAGLATLERRAREQEQAREKEALHDRVMKKEQEIADAKRAAEAAEYARTHKPVVAVKVCWDCLGRGGEYQTVFAESGKVFKKRDQYGAVTYSTTTGTWVKCVKCGGKGSIDTVEKK